MPHSSQNETNSNEVPQEGSKMLYGIGYTKMLWFVKYMVESKNKINTLESSTQTTGSKVVYKAI